MTDAQGVSGADDRIPDVEERIARVAFDANGLVPAVVQQHDTREVLMMAWMNADALRETLTTGRAVYWSRSRGELWRKGDTSGHRQQVKGAHIDCDGDTVLLLVDQTGGACHTGARTCFDTDERFSTGDHDLHPLVVAA